MRWGGENRLSDSPCLTRGRHPGPRKSVTLRRMIPQEPTVRQPGDGQEMTVFPSEPVNGGSLTGPSCGPVMRLFAGIFRIRYGGGESARCFGFEPEKRGILLEQEVADHLGRWDFHDAWMKDQRADHWGKHLGGSRPTDIESPFFGGMMASVVRSECRCRME